MRSRHPFAEAEARRQPNYSRARLVRLAGPLVLFLLLAPRASAEWPEFRGPYGDGHVAAPSDATVKGFPVRWSETENIRWKTAIPYQGYSAPVVLGGQVWLTTATVDGHDFFAICLDAETGKIRHNVKLFHSDDPEPLGNGASMNCYATPTSFIEKGRVYVHFGSFGTACLDTATAEVLWKRDDLPCRHYRGASSSVVSFEDLIILTFDGADLQYHAALDKRTGKTVWKTDRSVEWNDEDVESKMVQEGDWRKAHSTPLIALTGEGTQLISAGAKAAYGYVPRTGQELWRVEYADWSVAPRPLYDQEQGWALIVTGLNRKEMLAVKTDQRGDVTDSAVVWRLRAGVGKYASPILVDGLIYTAAEQSFLTCVEATSGEVVWTERIGGKYAASPIYADGRLYFLSQEGVTTVVKPGRSLEVLATNELDDGFMASPAADGRAFYLRTKTHLYRVEKE